MKRILMALSALLCLLGQAVVTCVTLGAWLWVVIATVEHMGVMWGWIALAGTFVALYRWPYVISAPWSFWLGLWRHIDEEMDRRLAD